MSESLTLEPSSMRQEGTTKPVAKRGFGAWFVSALESLVAAQSRGIDESGSLFFRYPPI
jgi:hypothetical protein